MKTTLDSQGLYMCAVQFDKTDDLIDIRYDNVFKAVFTRDRIITVELSKAGKIVSKSVAEMGDQEKWAVYFQYLTREGKKE